MTPIRLYRYPDDAPAWPGCAEVKKQAARYARARNEDRRAKAWADLVLALDGLDNDALGLWAEVVMIDGRFQAATGAGGFWSMASDAVNRAAKRILELRAGV